MGEKCKPTSVNSGGRFLPDSRGEERKERAVCTNISKEAGSCMSSDRNNISSFGRMKNEISSFGGGGR